MTTRLFFRRVWLAALVIAPSVAIAQSEPAPAAEPSGPAVGPPIQRITSASAVSTERLGSIVNVRELPDGRVLVNDGARRRLLLMDTTLTTVGVVLDSLAEVSNTYGTRPGALIPYRADSTLFVDPASYAMVVLDPAGKIARVRSVWRVEDLFSVTSPGGSYGVPGVDAKGRVVYRIPARPPRLVVAPPSGVPYFPPEPDSAFVVAVDLSTRTLDTLGVIRIPRSVTKIRQNLEGRLVFDQVINPLPSSDDWALLPDGTVAFVRARDYRIEYLNPDGSRTSSAKLPFEWQRLTDEDKQRMVDSVRTMHQRMATTEYVTEMVRWVNQYKRPYPAGFTVPEGYTPPPGFAKDWVLPTGIKLPPNYIHACPPGVEPTMIPAPGGAVMAAPPPGAAITAVPGPPAAGPRGMPSCIPAPTLISGGATQPAPIPRRVEVVPASELPDYRPPVAAGGAVRADADGNLWIRSIPPRPIPGGPVYDIVSRKGELLSRLQLPPGYALLGFGKDRVVYLSMRDANGIHLARVRLR
jgi:hypothetical protein